MIAAKGMHWIFNCLPDIANFFFQSKSLLPMAEKCVIPSTEACALWETPKPSLTYKSAKEASCSAKDPYHFFLLQHGNADFPALISSPGTSFYTAFSATASGPTQSPANFNRHTQ
jgi:hypothetical protein